MKTKLNCRHCVMPLRMYALASSAFLILVHTATAGTQMHKVSFQVRGGIEELERVSISVSWKVLNKTNETESECYSAPFEFSVRDKSSVTIKDTNIDYISYSLDQGSLDCVTNDICITLHVGDRYSIASWVTGLTFDSVVPTTDGKMLLSGHITPTSLCYDYFDQGVTMVDLFQLGANVFGAKSTGGDYEAITEMPCGTLSMPDNFRWNIVAECKGYKFLKVDLFFSAPGLFTGPVNAAGVVEVPEAIADVPEEWKNKYPKFESLFGTDFDKALKAKTGKKDFAGNELLVWHDYVIGTDPTNTNDVFGATITIVNGTPQISYKPQLSDAEKAKRKYTTWGKVKLQDNDWVEVPADHEADYNFFKVTVEMK